MDWIDEFGIALAIDVSGHQHKGKGVGGGQFTSALSIDSKLTLSQKALWANDITRECLLEAGDDVEAGLAAAEYIVTTKIPLSMDAEGHQHKGTGVGGGQFTGTGGGSSRVSEGKKLKDVAGGNKQKYVESKTVKEAKEYGRTLGLEYVDSLPNDPSINHNVKVGNIKGIRKLDVHTANLINKQLHLFKMSLNPEWSSKLKNIKVSLVKGNIHGAVKISLTEVWIGVNPNLRISEGFAENFVDPSLEGAIRHEMAHALENLSDHEDNVALGLYPMKFLASEYARENFREKWAEFFTLVSKPGFDISSLPKEAQDVARKVLRGKTDASLALCANSITRDRLSEKGESYSSNSALSVFFSHDIANRQAQGILNRSLKAAKGLSIAARKDLTIALKRGAMDSGEAILKFIEKYRIQLAKLLTTTQLASVLEGACEVAAKVPTLATFPGAIPPPPTLEPDEAIALVSRLEKMTGEERAKAIYDLPTEHQTYVQQILAAKEASPPIAPPSFLLPAPPENAPEGIHFPTIENAVADLAERNVITRDRYDALDSAARAKSFTVANVAAEETLTKIRDSLSENVREGVDYETWKEKVLQDVDSGTFMSDAHQETVFRTNVQSALSDGQEMVLSHPLIRSGFPYRARDAIHDDRVRENHLALEKLGIQGTNIYRADDPVWQMFRVPWDYNDRCADTALTVRQAARAGIKEAQDWLSTGVEPVDKAWVEMPDFRPPPRFQREIMHAPLSIQLSLKSIATFGFDPNEKRDESGKWTNNNSDVNEIVSNPGIISRIKSLPKTIAQRAISKTKKLYSKMEEKYGSRWAKAIVATAIITLPTPVTMLSVAVMTGLAHIHTKYTGKRSGLATLAVGDDLSEEQVKRLARRLIDRLNNSLRDHIRDLERAQSAPALKSLPTLP